jgi:hypothetical protein
MARLATMFGVTLGLMLSIAPTPMAHFYPKTANLKLLAVYVRKGNQRRIDRAQERQRWPQVRQQQGLSVGTLGRCDCEATSLLTVLT